MGLGSSPAEHRGPARLPGLPERVGDAIDEVAVNAASAVRIAAKSVRRLLSAAARPEGDADRACAERDGG